MFAALAIGLAAFQAVIFYLDSAISHPILQFWWVLFIAVFLIFIFHPSIKNNVNVINGRLVIIVSGLVPAAITWLFNDVLMIYLCGAWYLLLMANLNYICPNSISKSGPQKNLLTKITLLICVALLVLPISINRVSITLPNLSGGSHLAIFSSADENPPRSAHFYRRLASRNEIKIYLNTQIYIDQDHQAPLLRLKIDREYIVIAIQSIMYEHALGFLRFSLQKLKEGNLDGLSLDPISDLVHLTNPPGYGIVIQDLQIGEKAWIQLPHMDDHKLPISNLAVIYAVRLFFLGLIWLGIWSWRPRRIDHQNATARSHPMEAHS